MRTRREGVMRHPRIHHVHRRSRVVHIIIVILRAVVRPRRRRPRRQRRRRPGVRRSESCRVNRSRENIGHRMRARPAMRRRRPLGRRRLQLLLGVRITGINRVVQRMRVS